MRDLREFNLTGLGEHEHEKRDAHTDKTYTATTEFEYTEEGTSGGDIQYSGRGHSNVLALTFRRNDVDGTVDQRVGLQDSLKTRE